MWVSFTASSFGLTVAVATLSYYLYERPFLVLKDRLSRVLKVGLPAQNSHNEVALAAVARTPLPVPAAVGTKKRNEQPDRAVSR